MKNICSDSIFQKNTCKNQVEIADRYGFMCCAEWTGSVGLDRKQVNRNLNVLQQLCSKPRLETGLSDDGIREAPPPSALLHGVAVPTLRLQQGKRCVLAPVSVNLKTLKPVASRVNATAE